MQSSRHHFQQPETLTSVGGMMIDQAVSIIRNAEEEAQKIIENARKKRLELLDQARKKGEEELLNLVRNEKTIISEKISESAKKAETESAQLMEKASGSLIKNYAAWEKKVPDAVKHLEKFLVEG